MEEQALGELEEELESEFVSVVFPHYPLLEETEIVRQMLPLAEKLR